MKRGFVLSTALASLLLLMTACGTKSPTDELQKAYQKAQAGDAPGAIDDLKALQKQKMDDSTWAQATLMLAELESRQHNLDEARAQFQQVVTRVGLQNPNPQMAEMSGQAFADMERTYVTTGHPEKALSDVEATSATLKNISPDLSAELTMFKAGILFNMNKVDDAVKVWIMLADHSSDPGKQMFDLQQAATYYLHTDLRPQVEAELQKMKQNHATDAEVAAYRANVAAGLLDKAAEVYTDFLKNHPEFPMPVELDMNAGLIYSNAGNIITPAQKEKMHSLVETALDLFEQELAKPSGKSGGDMHQQLLLNKATALLVLDREPAAVDLLTSITKQQSFQPQVRATAMLNIGHYYETSKQFDKAKDTYQKMASEFPDTQNEAMQALQMISNEEASRAVRGTSQPASSQAASAPASQPSASHQSTSDQSSK